MLTRSMVRLTAAMAIYVVAPANAADQPAPKPPVIILKLDDITQSHEDGGPVSARWKRVCDYIESNNLKAGFGVICQSLEKDNPDYFNWIKEHQKKGFIEFWLHGYHERTSADKTGEFDQGTAQEHKAILEKCEKLAIEKLGFDFPAFGPHWSGTTDATDEALEQIPQIKIWLYGPKQPKFFKRLSLERVMALENPTFVPDFDKFKAMYERTGHAQPVLVLQGHANAWNDQRWAGFCKIIEFLKSQGCQFTTPSAYLQSVSPK